MSVDLDFKITGGAELAKALGQVTAKLETKILRAAVYAGSKVIADDAKSRAPVLAFPDPRRKSGTLKNAIRIRSTKLTRGQVMGGVQVRSLTAGQITKWKQKTGHSGADNPNDPFYARFVEFGTAKMAARPFMRPALSSKAQAAIDEVGKVVGQRLDEVVK